MKKVEFRDGYVRMLPFVLLRVARIQYKTVSTCLAHSRPITITVTCAKDMFHSRPRIFRLETFVVESMCAKTYQTVIIFRCANLGSRTAP